MNLNQFLITALVLLTVLTIVVAYNMYQENQYRKKIRRQFGHADQDVLMQSNTDSVRDGEVFAKSGLRTLKTTSLKSDEINLYPTESTEHIAENLNINQASEQQPENPETTVSIHEPNEAKTDVAADLLSPIKQPEHEPAFELTAPVAKKKVVQLAQKMSEKSLSFTGSQDDEWIEQLEELSRNELVWFDKRFDFMAYVALREPRELQVIPRLSVRQRFQIVGCTRDGRFQAAEPIPGVLYQAFVIGLQAISRKGLVGMVELEHFTAQVQQFAANMNGLAMIEDAEAFLEQAVALDELCARVDQTIAIHLVSRAGVSGVELRQSLERHGFVLHPEGSFVYTDTIGNPLYSLVALDGSSFTEALLSSQAYKGFSMLFDVTRVPNGEQNFNGFMTLAVRLSGDLNLDLVDDQIQPLSPEWLKEVRQYVGVLQQEMHSVNIQPAEDLAKRLFAA